MSLSKTFFRGAFGYPLQCSIPHLVIDGETLNGYPVIFLPREPLKITIGTLYEFMAVPTRDATYTIADRGSKLVYRVAHAMDPQAVFSGEGDFIDSILHRGTKEPAPLESRLPSGTLSGLAALKRRLEAS
jgi:hypothetical protein